MCLAIPHKILSIKGATARVQCGKKTHALDVRLLPHAKKGNWVMSENGYAVGAIPQREALKRLQLIQNVWK
ncbi:MAG: HypC/HybG/HupF family hydrogenase formation chaperone [Patescibacteria group bacterium]|nr:HypC/HybG/HupF family hydrogenase formation chaperone [Patescibacteria group bacterium]MDD5715201.1 HypC/HybG/HupF family hydrogenase formation chaperone [Patescibacteria group bacterium]